MIFANKRTLWTSSLAAAGILCMLGTAGCGMEPGGAAESPGSGGSGESSSGSDGPAKAAGTDPKESGGSGGSGGSDDTGDSANAEDSGSSEEGSGSDSSKSTCTTSDLEATLIQGGAAAGSSFRPIQFTNVSDSSCVMNGFPGVSYVAGDNGQQVGPAAEREAGEVTPVTLKQGDTASASVGFANVENFDAEACQPTPTRGLRVYPPGETEALFVAVPGTGCSSSDIPSAQLTVGPIYAGSGG